MATKLKQLKRNFNDTYFIRGIHMKDIILVGKYDFYTPKLLSLVNAAIQKKQKVVAGLLSDKLLNEINQKSPFAEQERIMLVQCLNVDDIILVDTFSVLENTYNNYEKLYF